MRTGNAASDQLQLDVWGEVLDGLAVARDAGLATTDDAWDLQVALMEHLEGRWQEPGSGGRSRSSRHRSRRRRGDVGAVRSSVAGDR